MRILITGGTGFVGSHTAAAALEAGHELRLLVRDPEKARRVFENLRLPVPDCTVGDITDPGCIAEAIDGCDAVVHAAAVVALQASRANEVLETNARGVDAVIGGAIRAGIGSIVYVSSIGALFQPRGPQLTANSPVVPGRNAYARSKAQGEETVRRWQAEGAPVRISYPTAVVGPDDPGLSESNHGVRTFLGTTMVMTSGGFQLIDVRDLARVHARLVELDDGPGRYLVAGRYFEWSELADLLDELTGQKVGRVRVPGPLLRVGGRIGDWVKRVHPFDFPLTGEAMSFATLWNRVDDTATRESLGVKYRDVRDTLAATLRWMVSAGHLDPATIGRLAVSFEQEKP